MNIVLSGTIPVSLIGQKSGSIATPRSAYTAILTLEYKGLDGNRSTVDWNIYWKTHNNNNDSQPVLTFIGSLLGLTIHPNCCGVCKCNWRTPFGWTNLKESTSSPGSALGCWVSKYCRH